MRTTIKLMQQQSKLPINVNVMKSKVEELMQARKIEVIANSWPLYFVVTMFMKDSSLAKETESNAVMRFY